MAKRNLSNAAWIALLAGLGLTSAFAATTYTYDSLGRLASVTYDNGKQIIYTYDGAGNRTARTVGDTASSSLPTTAADQQNVTQGSGPFTFDPRANDTNPSDLDITAVSPGVYGQAAINQSAGKGVSVTYTTTNTRNVVDEIVYTVRNSANKTASGLITYTLVNPAPDAVTDWRGATKNATNTIDPRTNDIDPDGDALTVTAITNNPSHGSATVQSGGAGISYTPTTNYTGTDSFDYRITDADGGTDTATVNVRVDNHAPIALNIWRSLLPNGSIGFDPRGNPTDVDGDTVKVIAVSTPAHGTATITNNGTAINYVPASNWSGTDTFTYTLSETYGGTATATATMTVDSAGNHAPIANNDVLAYDHSGLPFPQISLDPRINDVDPDGDPITIVSHGSPSPGYGTVTDSTSAVTYKLNTGSGNHDGQTDSFSYTISDGQGHTANGTVSVAISYHGGGS